MPAEEIARYAMSFVGGGLVAAIVGWVKDARSQVRQRRIAHLQDQVRLLYGPLHFLVAQNLQLNTLADNVNKAYSTHSEGKAGWPGGVGDSAIALSNAYAAKVRENLARARQVLEGNWSLIDPEDVEPFSAFLVDCVRMQVEVEEKKAEGLPADFRQGLGDIYYLRPGLHDLVKAKWEAKRGLLASL